MTIFKKQPRKLTVQELTEIQEINRIASAERFKAVHLKGNTGLIPKGKEVAEKQEAIAKLMDRIKGEHVSAKLAELGYEANEQVGIDLKTGKITRS